MDNYIRKATVVNVVDGDTVDAMVDLGYSITTLQRFRLLGVDTPERGQEGYLEAKTYVIERVLNKTVFIESEKSDSFGRYLANIYAYDSEDAYCLNDMLLINGLAKIYTK